MEADSLIDDGPVQCRREAGEQVVVAAQSLRGVVVEGVQVCQIPLRDKTVVVRRGNGLI